MPKRLHVSPAFTKALPAYLGGKRQLAPLITALIGEQRPRPAWGGLRLHDAFAGGCAFALHAKAMGFDVTASDVASRSVVTARALVENSNVRLSTADVLDLFGDAPPDAPSMALDFVGSTFTTPQARFIDHALARARLRTEPTRSLLTLVIIKTVLRMQPMSVLNATDAAAAIRGDLDHVSSRRLGHYLKADRLLVPATVQQIADDVNAGVIGGRGAGRQGDALTTIPDVRADVLYLDPPYPSTTGYIDVYGPLDQILGDIANMTPPPTLDALFDAARDVPLVVLSYGGPRVTLDGLVAIVGRHRPVLRALAIPYPHLRSLATKEKNRENREYLVVAGR